MLRSPAVFLCTLALFACLSAAQSTNAPNNPREPIKIVLDGARRPGDCMKEGRAVHDEVQRLVFPPGWTIAIICTPLRWEQLMRQIDEPKLHVAFTRMNERITVLNGAMFHEFPPNYHHVLAHELGHIRCGGCRDERRADVIAAELEHEADRARQRAAKQMAANSN